MSTISGATKQVIIPPSNEEPVRPRVAIPNETVKKFSIPKPEQIRHETILANMLLDQGVFVALPNGDLVHKDLVGKPHQMLPPSNLPYHPDDTRARQIR